MHYNFIGRGGKKFEAEKTAKPKRGYDAATSFLKTGFKEKTYVKYVTWFFFNEIQTAAYIEIGILHWRLTPIYCVNSMKMMNPK